MLSLNTKELTTWWLMHSPVGVFNLWGAHFTVEYFVNFTKTVISFITKNKHKGKVGESQRGNL